ncbi:unnamed protein product, partial [Rotaria socialis]
HTTTNQTNASTVPPTTISDSSRPTEPQQQPIITAGIATTATSLPPTTISDSSLQ